MLISESMKPSVFLCHMSEIITAYSASSRDMSRTRRAIPMTFLLRESDVSAMMAHSVSGSMSQNRCALSGLGLNGERKRSHRDSWEHPFTNSVQSSLSLGFKSLKCTGMSSTFRVRPVRNASSVFTMPRCRRVAKRCISPRTSAAISGVEYTGMPACSMRMTLSIMNSLHATQQTTGLPL